MSFGQIPNAKALLDQSSAAYEASMIEACGHGVTWDQECSDCDAVWREDQVRDLVKVAARYGFRLVPL